jgi:hypothetical protein
MFVTYLQRNVNVSISFQIISKGNNAKCDALGFVFFYIFNKFTTRLKKKLESIGTRHHTSLLNVLFTNITIITTCNTSSKNFNPLKIIFDLSYGHTHPTHIKQ